MQSLPKRDGDSADCLINPGLVSTIHHIATLDMSIIIVV